MYLHIIPCFSNVQYTEKLGIGLGVWLKIILHVYIIEILGKFFINSILGIKRFEQVDTVKITTRQDILALGPS